ncbi:MAG: hypothetical protein ABGX23_00735 [Nautiliaceae bacterium]
MDKFLEIIKESIKVFINTSSRSNKKLKVLHGGIKDLLQEEFIKEGIKLDLVSLTLDSSVEDVVKGRYYDKRVDISIRDDKVVGAIGVKFVMNNYSQNANNYFENMLGETANIRSTDIPYFQIFILFDKVPYFDNNGRIKRIEVLSQDTHLKKYIKLSEDDINLFYHTPILTLLTIISLPEDVFKTSNKEEFNKKMLKAIMENKLKYSDKFDSNIFKNNVILNDHSSFFKRLISYLQFKGHI